MADIVDISSRQKLFLDALRTMGTIRKAAALAHVGRSTVDKWRSDNTNGFRALFDEALDDFADGLEDKMFALLEEMKVGHNPTLLIFALKAARPLKYRELTQIPDDHARELLRKLELLVPVAAPELVDKPDPQATVLEQVERILKEGPNAS